MTTSSSLRRQRLIENGGPQCRRALETHAEEESEVDFSVQSKAGEKARLNPIKEVMEVQGSP